MSDVKFALTDKQVFATLFVAIALGGCHDLPRGNLAIRGDSTAIATRGGFSRVYALAPRLDSDRWWVRLACAKKPCLKTFNDGVGGQNIASMRNKMEKDIEHQGWPTIIYDRLNDEEIPDLYIIDLERAVSEIKTDRFLIMPQIPRAGNGDNQEYLERAARVDAEVSRRWPENTLSAAEKVALKQKLSSSDTRTDGLHRNARGQAIEAEMVEHWTSARGWW